MPSRAPLPPRRPGRPRSDRAHAAILNATSELLVLVGFAGMTIDAVAERAGVGRQTIYRRWPSKLALVIALLAELSESAPLPDTGSIRSDIAQLARRYATPIRSSGGSVFPGLIAESMYNAELATVMRDYIMKRRHQAMKLFERAIERGEIDAGTNYAMVIDLMSGFTWYRRLIAGLEIEDADADTMADIFLRGIRPHS